MTTEASASTSTLTGMTEYATDDPVLAAEVRAAEAMARAETVEQHVDGLEREAAREKAAAWAGETVPIIVEHDDAGSETSTKAPGGFGADDWAASI